MCGRYHNRADKQRIANAFRVGIPPTFDIAPSYNVAPHTFQPVIRLDSDTSGREIVKMRWGLIPFFASDAKVAYSTVNARAETVASRPIFRESMKRRRCLVPATGFYEWQASGKKTKQPWVIEPVDGDVFAFAGLWDRWKDKTTGLALETYTIITTDANELLEPIHDRMPVILSPQDYERWLDPGEPSHLPLDLLRPYPAEKLKAWKVSSAVGNVKNNSAELRLPIDSEPAGLFYRPDGGD